MKRWIKTLIWVVAIVAAVMLVLSLIAGPVVKSYLNRHSEKLTGRQAHVENVGVNLFSGHVYVRDFSILEDDKTTTFANFDTLDLRMHLLGLLFHSVNFRHITLSGFHVNINQQGDRFNFSSLLDHFKSDDSDTDTTPSRWTVRLHNLRLSHASIKYKDMLSRKELFLPDVNLKVPGFTVGGTEQSEGGLTIGFADGGNLNIKANYDAAIERYDMQARLDNFALENIQEFVSDYINIESLKGTLHASVNAKGEIQHLLNSQIGGDITLTGMNLSTDEEQLAELSSLAVSINNINLDRMNFDVQSLLLDGMQLHFVQQEGHNTFSDLLVAKNQEESTSDSVRQVSNPRPLSLSISDLQIKNCSFDYTDNTLPYPFHFPVTGITLTASNLSTRGPNNTRMRAVLPGGGTVSLRWNGTLKDWKQYQEVALNIKGLDLKQLNPLIVAYTARPFEDGILGLSSRLTINNSTLENDNKLDIYKATVGKKDKNIHPEKNIPIKTALYILKDKNEKIMIDLPVSGNIDSPEFNYMKLVWKTLGNFLVKVATSPARALGNAMGLGDSNLDFIPTTGEQHSLTSEQYHILSQLASIAKENELMVYTFEHRVNAASDSVAVQRLDRQVQEYMSEQGIGDDKLTITHSTTTSPKERTGYSIISELMIEE